MGIVQEAGAAAGLAAVVGLAVLLAVHLSAARDVKRLRAWAGGTHERSERRIGRRRLAGAFVGLLVLGGAAAQLTGGHGADHSDKPRRRSVRIKPGNVTVAVLNATTVPGLAATLRDRIAAAGFKKGTINVFSDQQLAASVVQYVPGHQAEAQAVGRRFAISRREPVSADSRALAGDATVVVIAGADKAP